ncbi:ParB/Srx family N-terminal domain-containing protein [Methylomonas sp. EFPC3]|uniref:ParB/Srx family N-terminal domain-containing protein n=1 Tax=Methylomonas sp. EFPC3 TaxID=3021710 RepID=UPI00241655D9|nr:ParB/Srx family N-terminal domain-containing protein [Methylomonas sp. EFPC3]WFP50267.1 ParB/Srx family N-terminal domain-containing protein [Methylomonas sp. EFPC3]
MKNLSNLLTTINVTLSDLLLDPNNPRFSELGEELNPIPEGRFLDIKVQANTFDKMRDPLFDVAELRDTIKTIGFLPMDRIVVRKWKGNSEEVPLKYVVIEGNRRVTALKWLINLHDIGKETFDDEKLENLTRIECLLLDDSAVTTTATLILPGLRHVSGVKQWGAYQKAKAVHALRKSGMTPQEAAQSLGLSTRAANSAYKCFLALEQMKIDEEYGEYAEPKMYSYFEEVFKRSNLRNWLGWSDESERFTEEEKLTEFYSWMAPQSEDDPIPKLPESKSVRDLSQIIGDENALNILRGSEGSLTRALARYEVDHPEDWYPKVVAATSAIKSLTPDILRSMDENTIKSLEELVARINQALNDRKLLIN